MYTKKYKNLIYMTIIFWFLNKIYCFIIFKKNSTAKNGFVLFAVEFFLNIITKH